MFWDTFGGEHESHIILRYGPYLPIHDMVDLKMVNAVVNMPVPWIVWVIYLMTCFSSGQKKRTTLLRTELSKAKVAEVIHHHAAVKSFFK